MSFNPHSVITSILRPLGYKRQGNYWTKQCNNYLVYLVLYGSSYGGGDKYINVRAFFEEIAEPGENFKNTYDASTRLQETGPLGGSLNYHHEYKNLTDEEREVRLRNGLINYGLPLLQSYETVDGLKELWLYGIGTLMSPKLRELIGLPYEHPG